MVFTGTCDRVLPAPPAVQRIRSGSTDGDFKQNEVQALIVPSAFRGTYYLRWDFRTTKLLGIDDGPQEIAAALNAMFPRGGSHFDVTNPEPDRAYIEFIGELGGAPQPLIEVSVHSFDPGVLTFTLDLARSELASALRDTAQVELPFEVELEVVEEGEDAADPTVPGRLITLFQQPIKIAREQIWEELADIPAIDWLRPPQPRDYIPFTRDQIITGSQHYIAVIGDGVQRGFSLAHNLDTSAYHLTIRENKANGRRLPDNEFALHFPSDNEAALDFPADAPPPAVDGLVVTISSAGPRSIFERHTHYASEIIGLDDRFYVLGARVAAIEQLLPTAPPTANAATAATGLSISLASFAQLAPGKWRPGFDVMGAFSKGTGLPSRGGGLLPAIHSATATNAILPLPNPAAHSGVLFINNTADPITLPGGLGRKSASVAPGGFFGSDGRVWYALTRDVTPANTTSYFPRDFERELFRIAVSDKMLRAGQTLTAEFDLTLAMLRADTAAQWLLVIECGAAIQDSAPATTGENLADLTWQAAPLLSQRIILTAAAYPSRFGVSIARNAAGTVITASKLLYGQYEACGTAPDSADFTLRARLIQFDTQDSVPGARGWAYFSFDNAQAGIL